MLYETFRGSQIDCESLSNRMRSRSSYFWCGKPARIARSPDLMTFNSCVILRVAPRRYEPMYRTTIRMYYARVVIETTGKGVIDVCYWRRWTGDTVHRLLNGDDICIWIFHGKLLLLFLPWGKKKKTTRIACMSSLVWWVRRLLWP